MGDYVKVRKGKKEMGVNVLLDSVEKIKDFVEITRCESCDIDLISGRNTYLDAKSLLGILSCDCTKPLKLDIHADKTEAEEFIGRIDKYVVA